MKIAVIGGGITGLTMSYLLTGSNHQVHLFEKETQLGGLAASVVINRHPVERHHHFICGGDHHLVSLIGELGLRDHLCWRYVNMSYFINGRYYPFSTPLDLLRLTPLSLRGRLRFGLHAIRIRSFRDFEQLDAVPAEQWLIDNIGREAYQTIWRPLLKFKFHDHYQNLSAAWIWHRMYRVSQSRRNFFKPDYYGFLKHGTQTLIDRLSGIIARRGGTLRTGTMVTGTSYTARGNVILTCPGRPDEEFDAVIFALPTPLMRSLVPETESALRQRLGAINYLSVISTLLVRKKTFSDSFWVNINDPQITFNGIIDYSSLNPRPELAPLTLTYIPNYLPAHDPLFSQSDAAVGEFYVRQLPRLDPGASPDSIHDIVISRSTMAQPVCETGFLSRIIPIRTGSPNIYLLDATQLYPSDRTLDGLIGLCRHALTYFS